MMKFALNAKTVVEAIEELENPFADDSTDLVTLNTKVIMSEEVVTNIQTTEQLGSTQYQSVIDERMSGSTKSLYMIQSTRITCRCACGGQCVHRV